MPRIELINVSKRWGKFVGVDNLNMVIEDRDFITLLGPSGCGKTTTLRMIAGLETPTEGKIIIGDRVVFDSETGINFDKCYDDARIRLHFSEALKSVSEGSDLAALLGYSFSSDDLMELMKLHKKNKFRKKIEDMLTGANFHSECGLLCSQQYEDFADFVNRKGA